MAAEPETAVKPIAILETGKPPTDLQDAFDDYPARFRALLGEGVATVRFDVQAGRLPDDPTEFQGAIVTGSAAGVYDDLPWIAPLLDWLRAARGKTRLVGICFGHQAMAQAFGGHVAKSDKGWGVGLHRYDVVADEPWMFPRAASIAIPVSHQDQVLIPPADARVIASSAFTPYAGLAWDDPDGRRERRRLLPVPSGVPARIRRRPDRGAARDAGAARPCRRGRRQPVAGQ
jgi:GMP synthase-like glutamine amidotransferase